MKKKLKLFSSILFVLIPLISCDKSSLNPVFEPEVLFAESQDNFSSSNDSIKLGDRNISPLTSSLTNLVSENFESGGRTYYCYQLKLEKLYPGSVAYPNGGAGFFDLSYSINFKFFTDEENGPLDEVLTVELLANILPYYKAMDQSYAVDKKAVAFLYGDRSFNPNLVGKKYTDYLNSQIRIKSGSLHLKKSGEMYVVSFEGETETGEKVSCNFNEKISFYSDNNFESQENDFSLTEIPGNYIQKDGKYYKLDDGYYFVFSPYTYNGNTIHTVQASSWREYYWYKYNTNWYEENSGMIYQHFKSNAMVLQFQFAGLNQFQPKTYQAVPSEGVYAIGNMIGIYRYKPFNGFPNDSLFVGYYHIATDSPTTLTYNEDKEYMKNQIALKSGQLEISNNSSGYVFSGSFIDAHGEEVKVKFKAILYPGKYDL